MLSVQASDDERDELVEQLNLHGNSIQCMDGLEAFTGYGRLGYRLYGAVY